MAMLSDYMRPYVYSRSNPIARVPTSNATCCIIALYKDPRGGCRCLYPILSFLIAQSMDEDCRDKGASSMFYDPIWT
ncbi:predicted protein [Lichtheimia corymbifera JMRC:FSU:9682]|uniref:Uncharacterized protein n=1 Tax=Lichtheimia corymbifera JMRC:FSU:9682 TaxID=1263082 RepID=A0A068SBF4_9FUNG|nr:predicted protein [Lichtheimia corymbifera JMRC:FSU:9682]